MICNLGRARGLREQRAQGVRELSYLVSATDTMEIQVFSLHVRDIFLPHAFI